MKDLMRRTFPNQWDAYINNNEPSTLLEYLSQYPLLKKASFVSICILGVMEVMCAIIIIGMCTYATTIYMYIYFYKLNLACIFMYMQQAAQEFALVCKKEDICDSFEKLPIWLKLLCSTAKTHRLGHLLCRLRHYSTDTMDDGMFYLPDITCT